MSIQATTHVLLSNQTVYSSITNVIKAYLIRKFPKDFFKYVYMRNSDPSVTEQYLDYEDKLIKPKPALAIGMSFENQDTTFVGDSFHFGVSNIRQHAHEQKGIYDVVLRDPISDIYLSTFRSRIKLIYDVGIKVETEMKASSLETYIRAYLGINRPFYLNDTSLEISIPNGAIVEIANLKGINISTPLGVTQLNAYLKDISQGSITYKKNLNNGRMHYYFKYFTNVLCKISDRISIQKNMKDKSVQDTILGFQFEIECGNYLNFINEFIPAPTGIPSFPINNIDTTFDEIAYNYTMQRPIPPTFNNKDLFTSVILVSGNDPTEDVTSFDTEIDSKIKSFIEFLKGSLSQFPNAITDNIEVMVHRENVLVPGSQYTVDWTNYSIALQNPFANYQYTIAFYMNMELYIRYTEAKHKFAYGIDVEQDIT